MFLRDTKSIHKPCWRDFFGKLISFHANIVREIP